MKRLQDFPCLTCGKPSPRGRKTCGRECKREWNRARAKQLSAGLTPEDHRERVTRAWREGKMENRRVTPAVVESARRANEAAKAQGKLSYWKGRPSPNPDGRPPLPPEERKARRLARAVSRSSEVKLSPARISELRAEIAQAVTEQLADAHRVVMGTPDEDGNVKSWSPTQARVFSILINKVIPDLHASYVKREDDNRDLNELSREELERIVSGLAKIEAKGTKPPDPRSIPDAEIITDEED